MLGRRSLPGVMRVIVIADFAVRSGGSQSVAITSARGLAEAGASVVYLHSVAGADPALDHPRIERVCLDLPDVWSRPGLAAATSGVWSRKAARRASDALAPFVGASDVAIHLHQWTRALSPSIFPVLRATGRPVAVTAHDYFLACPNGVFFRFDRNEPCALAPMSLGCVAAHCDPRSYPHKLVRLARQAATTRQWPGWTLDVVHISDRARARLEPLLPAGWRHHRVDNPIRATRAAPAAIHADAAFAYVGRLTADKGAVIAARAAARAGARMIFVGDGPARSEIEAALPGAEITGWIDAEAVAPLLRARARALVAPSLWPETGPLTVAEAAAIGLPSIVSDRCGAAERVQPGEGRVVEPGEAEIAGAMRELMDDGAARAMGAAAHARFWADPPSAASHAAKLLALYEAMLAR